MIEKKLNNRIEAREYYDCINYPNWLPYCLKCRTMNRMTMNDKGFKCKSCNNQTNFNLYNIDVTDDIYVKDILYKVVNETLEDYIGQIESIDLLNEMILSILDVSSKKLTELMKKGWLTDYKFEHELHVEDNYFKIDIYIQNGIFYPFEKILNVIHKSTSKDKLC